MRSYINQKGLSLIEVLATLALLSIVSGLVFGVLINSLDIFEHESESNDVKQEANLVSNQLTTFYKMNGNYSAITDVNGVLNISTVKNDTTTEIRKFKIPDYVIDVEPDNSTDGESSKGSYTSIDIKISIYEIDNPENSFTLNSNISRITGGDKDEDS